MRPPSLVRRRRTGGTGLVLALVLAGTGACGTTVPNGAGQGGSVLQGGSGLGAPSEATGNAGPALGTAPGAAGSGPLATSGPAADGPSGPGGHPRSGGISAANPTVAVPGTNATRVGPGVTPTKVYLGLGYCSDCAAANASAGAAGGQDERTFYNLVIKHINAHGGVAGRMLEPIYAEFRATSSDTTASQFQAACSTWTEDHKVFLMLTQNEIGWSCARKAGVVAYGAAAATGRVFARYPALLSAQDMRLERVGEWTVKGLSAQNYFQGWNLATRATTDAASKVGIVSWDDPSYRYALDHGWLPALRRLGYTPEISYVKVPDSFDGVGASSAAVSSAVLRFQSHGIDHVLINDGSAGIFTGAGLTLLFLNSAESQRYWPRYGFNSFNAPGFSGLPADQQRGMLAVSWTDFEPTDDAGWRANRARDLCFKILRDGGAEPSDAISRFEAAAACDVLFLIDRVISGADRLTVAAFMAAATALGTSYESPYVYRTRLAPNQRDGANGVRNSRYDDSCTCMRYTSAPYTPQ